ncbi:Rhodanese-like domain containing protein [Lotmaria passim]
MLRAGATASASSAAAVYQTTCRRFHRGISQRAPSSAQDGHRSNWKKRPTATVALALTLTLHITSQNWRARWRITATHPDALVQPSLAHLQCQCRTAATSNVNGSFDDHRNGRSDADRAKDLAAAESELHHLRQDVSAIDPMNEEGDVAAAGGGAVPSGSSLAMRPAGDSKGGPDGESLWEEPTLADLDRSIPQVDCEFIASLIRSRNLRRDEFLARKEAVKQRVDQLTKKSVPSINDATRLPLVGGLNLGWLTNLRDGVKGGEDGADGGVVATSADAPVVVSTAVLDQLSAEEKDFLHTTRPEYDDGFVLIDCRTVNEVTSWGIIEGAKVLPAHELFEAFHATPEEFLQDYGFAKPRPDDIIICYCQYGPRSLMAAQILSWMGYLKVMHFRDGYYEWGKQYNLLLRRWMEHDKESGNELRRLATFRAGLELQREIAPEFNALPMKEAQKYVRDTTRSRGTLLVGEGLRVEAYTMVAKLTEGLAPPALPGVLDSADSASGSLGDGDTRSSGTVSGLASKSTQTRRKGEGQLAQFLEQATGMNPHTEMQRQASSITLGEAQATVLDSLASGSELGASPDAVTSPLQQRSRPN